MTEAKFPNPRKWLSIPLCESTYNIFRENQALIFPHGEPIPSFNTRYSGRLESILGSVQLKSEKLSYDLVKTAVAYYVHLAKSQAFLNGNKRMSIILAGVFLLVNDYRLGPNPKDFADITLLVSEDKTVSTAEMIRSLTPYFHNLIIKA